MDTRVYIMTHKSFTAPEDNLYLPLHVGRSISDSLGYQGDNQGDNISHKNKSYCELTGIYWLWKHVSCDIIGVCHYRRYFIDQEDFISKEQIENLLDKYDVILPRSNFTQYTSLTEHYATEHFAKDLAICRDIISRRYPEYLPAYDMCMNCNLFSLGNMLITHKSIFDQYCEWLFNILFEAEPQIDSTGYNDYQKRVMGYLSERLLRVWFLKNGYKVYETEVRMINPADCYNERKAVSLKYKYVQLVLQDIVEQYQNTPPDNITPAPITIDFHNKIPVWVCWWQGFDAAPEIIRMCINSIKRNIPSDKAEVHLITLNNVSEYVAFPEHIINRFNNGNISLTHLSDLLRMELLYRYGGIWIDASYFMLCTLPEYWFNTHDNPYIITHRTSSPPWKADIVQGRWSISLIAGNAGNPFFSFMLDSLYTYYKRQNELIDYFLTDYVIALAYDYIPYMHNLIATNHASEPMLHELIKHLNETYTPEQFDFLTKDTNIFKLSYKLNIHESNLFGQKTIYGKLKDL